MAKTRKAVVDLMLSWEGKNEADGSYKEIIDIYNSWKKEASSYPRGLKMEYGWAWCACTVSAAAIKLKYTSIIPIEIGCGEMIELAKKKGIWQEKDNYVPDLADIVMYDWDDTGKGDDKGWPEHVGFVIEVNKTEQYFVVMEGNYKNSVKRRKMDFNDKFIRGFITPKYNEEPVKKDESVKQEESVKKEDDIKKVVATDKAAKFDESVAGTYQVTTALYCRNGAGANKKAMCIIPAKTKVKCHGYYTMAAGRKWYYIQFTMNGVQYTGFSSSKYLNKI